MSPPLSSAGTCISIRQLLAQKSTSEADVKNLFGRYQTLEWHRIQSAAKINPTLSSPEMSLPISQLSANKFLFRIEQYKNEKPYKTRQMFPQSSRALKTTKKMHVK